MWDGVTISIINNLSDFNSVREKSVVLLHFKEIIMLIACSRLKGTYDKIWHFPLEALVKNLDIPL